MIKRGKFEKLILEDRKGNQSGVGLEPSRKHGFTEHPACRYNLSFSTPCQKTLQSSSGSSWGSHEKAERERFYHTTYTQSS